MPRNRLNINYFKEQLRFFSGHLWDLIKH